MNNVSKEDLQKYYDNHSNIETAQYLGVSKTQMMRILNKLGIKKKTKFKNHIPVNKTIELLLATINIDDFKIDCTKLVQKELSTKYNITVRQISYLKKYLGIGNRLTYSNEYNINKIEFEKYYKQHTLQETADNFNISSPTMVKNLLKYYNIPIEKRLKETVEEATTRINKEELESFYNSHTIAETEAKFETKNLRNILNYFNITKKTKQRESINSIIARIDKDAFYTDYINLPIAVLFSKYNIAYTSYRKLINYYNLGYKPGAFTFSDASLSKCEDDLADYISSLIGADAIVRNDRTALSGKEIDIYIPTYKVGIEFNGNY